MALEITLSSIFKPPAAAGGGGGNQSNISSACVCRVTFDIFLI